MTTVENFLFIYFFCTAITYYIIEAYKVFLNHNSTKQNKMVFIIVVVAIYLSRLRHDPFPSIGNSLRAMGSS